MTQDTYGSDTRTRILDAARDAFSENGYHGTSIRQIIARAGTNVASVNYHFGSKDALYEAVLNATLSDLTLELGSALEGPEVDDHPDHRIRAFARNRIAAGLQEKRFRPPRLIAWEVLSPKLGVEKILEKPFANAEEQCQALLSPLFGADATDRQKSMAVRWFFAVTLPPPPVAFTLETLLAKDANAADVDAVISYLADAAVAGVIAMTSGDHAQQRRQRPDEQP